MDYSRSTSSVEVTSATLKELRTAGDSGLTGAMDGEIRKARRAHSWHLFRFVMLCLVLGVPQYLFALKWGVDKPILAAFPVRALSFLALAAAALGCLAGLIALIKSWVSPPRRGGVGTPAQVAEQFLRTVGVLRRRFHVLPRNLSVAYALLGDQSQQEAHNKTFKTFMNHWLALQRHARRKSFLGERSVVRGIDVRDLERSGLGNRVEVTVTIRFGPDMSSYEDEYYLVMVFVEGAWLLESVSDRTRYLAFND